MSTSKRFPESLINELARVGTKFEGLDVPHGGFAALVIEPPKGISEYFQIVGDIVEANGLSVVSFKVGNALEFSIKISAQFIPFLSVSQKQPCDNSNMSPQPHPDTHSSLLIDEQLEGPINPHNEDIKPLQDSETGL